MQSQLSIKVCSYIERNIRPKYSSNREFADIAGIDEKTVRLILEKKYNFSLHLFKKICDSQEIKMSTVLRELDE